jgi:RNA polymerase sigma-70 factor (ECF subfamily)
MSADEAAARLRLAAERARGGNASAFRELVDRSHETVFRLAAAQTGDRDEAADVVQETYIRAWERIGDLRDGAAVTAWLARIARNAAHERRRSWWSRIRAPLDAAPEERLAGGGERPAADAALEAAERADAVRRALARLPEKHRAVLALREVEGMTYEDIAAALGVPVGTVESRLHRARRALAGRLEKAARREEP